MFIHKLLPLSWRLLPVILLALSGCQEPPGENRPGENRLGEDGSGNPANPKTETPLPQQPALPVPALTPNAIRANNRAVGLMGRFEYAEALEIFASLVAAHPHWRDARVNLAIATLNRQRDGDERAALALANEVLAVDPDHPRAHYVAGLLRLYLSSPEQALGHFAKVAEQDPEDAYAAYYLGQCLAQQSKPAQALAAYRKALALDPYLRSAAYGAFQSLQQLRHREEAHAFIEQYQRLAANPRGKLAEFKYTRMGPKAEALAAGEAPEKQTPPPPPPGAVFAPEAPLPVHASVMPVRQKALETHEDGRPPRPVSMTVMDLESDGWPDLFVAGQGKRPSLLLGGTQDGQFVERAGHPLTRVSGVNAVLWGDFDNDGHLDAYLCRRGANQLWRNLGRENQDDASGARVNGAWVDVTAATGAWNGTFDTVDGAFFDADHDGDLDIFLINRDGPNGLLYNNRDGTFRADSLEGPNRNQASRMVIPADLDRDRDTDIIVLNREPPHEVHINDRLWAYHSSENFAAFQASPALSAVVGDVDSDGLPEIHALTPQGEWVRWSRGPEGGFVPTSLGIVPGIGASPWAQMSLFDADGDGKLELAIATPAGWSVFRVPEQTEEMALKPLFTASVPDNGLLGVTPLLLGPGRGFAMAGWVARGDLDGEPVYWPAGPGRYPFLSLSFSGMEDTASAMRSNASGIGTRLTARVGTRWTIMERFRDHTGPGQGLQPAPVGLGGAERMDFVRVDWPDGVLQSELDLAPGELHPITETQRQLSSCPVLFAWDGEKYAFITDFLGVGGLGYAIGPGQYSVPRPWENLLLPPSVQPKWNHYLLKLTEPMEEVTYLDAAALVAYDLPPGWQMALDERMGVQGPEPTGAAIFYRREYLPEKAVNERGQVVTPSVLEADGQAAPPGPLDRRFIGRLADTHSLTLTFPEDAASQKHRGAKMGPPVLIIDGWVEYPYSQTMFAAWQANAHWEAPTIEALGSDGKWYTVLQRFGYPAGMPRRMSVPLPGLLPGSAVLRIRTNQEIYWDRIAMAFPEPLPGAQKHTLLLDSAQLAIAGFPARTTGPQRRPHFDYSHRRPFQDMRPMAGFYTRPGPVAELVGTADDALAIFGAGEEIRLSFRVPDQPLPQGWRRYLVLETHGWTKDGDLYTKDGESVTPLPQSGKEGGKAGGKAGGKEDRRRQLHAKYNTRAVFP